MDVHSIRKEFPILRQKNRGKDLIYFDTAATSLKPISVIEAESKFYKEYGGSVHRSVYELGEKQPMRLKDQEKKLLTSLEQVTQHQLSLLKVPQNQLILSLMHGVFKI